MKVLIDGCVSWKLSRTVLIEWDRSNPVLALGTFTLLNIEGLITSDITSQLRLT
jgi:hypothetical protein